jgi:anti-sigma28 factor (negative regulator of flagellin synthesis)
MNTREQRERRIRRLRGLVQAGLYEADPDRIARAILAMSRKKVLGQLDGTPGC